MHGQRHTTSCDSKAVPGTDVDARPLPPPGNLDSQRPMIPGQPRQQPHRLGVYLVIFVQTVGCSASIPTGGKGVRGLVLGYAAKNSSCHTSRRITPGIDLRMSGPWAGLSLGWSDVTVTTPPDRSCEEEQTNPDDNCPDRWHYTPPLGIRKCTEDGTDLRWGSFFTRVSDNPADVVFVRFSEIGSQIRWSPISRGVSVGAGRGTTLVVDPKTDGMFLVHCGRFKPFPCKLVEVR